MGTKVSDERLASILDRMELLLDKQSVAETAWSWGYASDRQDWDTIRKVCTEDLRAEVYIRGVKMHEVTNLENYLEGYKGVFAGGVRAAIHSYNPGMVVRIDGDQAQARWASKNAHAFGDDVVEIAEGYADCWYRRSDTSPTGWRAAHIVFHYLWGDDGLRTLMEGGLIKKSTDEGA